jgi:hypothetical protein
MLGLVHQSNATSSIIYLFFKLSNLRNKMWLQGHICRGFYGTQYHPVPPIEKDSYVIEKDLYVRTTIEINCVPPIFCGMGGIHRWYG